MRIVSGAELSVWTVGRDEQMLAWFGIVRVTDVERIRWVLEALNGLPPAWISLGDFGFSGGRSSLRPASQRQ